MACIMITSMACNEKLWNPTKPFPLSANYTRQRAKSYVSTVAATSGHAGASSQSIKLHDQTVFRRSANYPPPTWKFDDIQSHETAFLGEIYKRRATKLKEQINVMLYGKKEPLDQLELIDDLQRLGLSYHFESQIKQNLTSIYNKISCSELRLPDENNLYATALAFRLLRQHGFNVPQDIFYSYIMEDGEIKPALLYEHTKGLLYLYEASYFVAEGESTLELVMKSATKHLKKNLDDGKLDEDLAVLVSHALELPLHWRMPRLVTRWFIDIYERRSDMNHVLLELAKLDFNMVQAQHLQDLKDMSWWWKRTGLAEKLTFARDRLVENFFWTIGLICEPQYGHFRKTMTKVITFITTIDDVYDVYGTLDELELFTDAVERWDINAIEQLPNFMKVCFLALYNNINDMAYDTLKEHGGDHNIIPYLRKGWGDLCKTYLQEAKWYYSGYTPTLEEYLDNAWISISVPLSLVHVFFLVTSPFEEEALGCLHNYHDIIRWSAMIFRLADDLATSSEEIKRGDVPKSIQCYMNDTGVSEEKAREHIKLLIGEIWKKMNKDRVTNSPFSETFIRVAMNHARMSQCMYQHGDGHGKQNDKTKNRIIKLLFEPISLA